MNFRNFDVIAKDLVIADFERIHTQAFPFTGFQGSDPIAAILDFGVHLVEFWSGTFTDHAAFTHGHRKVVVQHTQNFVALAFCSKKRFCQIVEEWRL